MMSAFSQPREQLETAMVSCRTSMLSDLAEARILRPWRSPFSVSMTWRLPSRRCAQSTA